MSNEKSKLKKRAFLKKIAFIPAFVNFFFISSVKTAFGTKSGKDKADLIVVWKSKRKMILFNQSVPIKEYYIKLGFNPIGHKISEGDGRTPEGRYFIDRINLKSRYHKSLGISYPNKKDIATAKKRGLDPGGEIFIHGGPRKNWLFNFFRDWTAGCIAVSDREIEEIVNLVPVGTVIYIYK